VDNDVLFGGGSLSGVASGSLEWDGLDDEGVLASMGIYIVSLEGADPEKGRLTDRQVVVLGRPLQ
jgi:hypothetical protein